MKKLLFLTVLTMLFAVNAAAATKNGTIDGTSIDWTYDTESCVLTLSGSGDIPSTLLGNGYFGTNNDAYLYSITAGKKTIDFYITDDVTKIIITGSITKLGDNCFANAEYLETVTVESPLKEISEGAFYACSALENFENIPEDIVIDELAFNGCNKLLNNGVLILGNTLVKAYASGMENNTTYSIPNIVTKINSGAFSGNGKLVSITIPASVKTIGKVFDGCSNLTTVTFEGDINSIGNDAFTGCSNLTTVTFEGDINSIGDRAFANCSSLNNINIPSSVTTWGEKIFSGCTSLPDDGTYQKAGDHVIVKVSNTGEKQYRIPSNIIYIAENAFSACDKVTKIVSEHTTIPQVATSAFTFTKIETPNIYVEDGKETECANKWGIAATKINHTTIPVGSTGYATVSLEHSAQVPSGVKAYTVYVEDGQIKLKEVSKLAKHAGYMLYGDVDNHTFKPLGNSYSETEKNDLVGLQEDEELSGSDKYLLTSRNGDVKFRCLDKTSKVLTAGKAYLSVPNATASEYFVRIISNDDTETDIDETLENNAHANNRTIYNIAGQRVNQPRQGLNIIDGKLVIM